MIVFVDAAARMSGPSCETDNGGQGTCLYFTMEVSTLAVLLHLHCIAFWNIKVLRKNFRIIKSDDR
jgi:hypothetical protein